MCLHIRLDKSVIPEYIKYMLVFNVFGAYKLQWTAKHMSVDNNDTKALTAWRMATQSLPLPFFHLQKDK